MPFNHFNGGSSPLGLNYYISGYTLMVNRTPSKRFMSVQIRLSAKNFFCYIYIYIRVSFLIGKELSCQESLCRFEPDLARIYINCPKLLPGKVAIGKVRYLLNIVRLNLSVRFTPFPIYWHYKQILISINII